ncbi:carboxypeptidase regulatory-like domain-containing protein, partial [Candidatus Peregrinibacteria bacterium]|nr:carboxypeptidase regulatory-like domain-containing protein [Candidatus Peregrinibacteria bacterium]
CLGPNPPESCLPIEDPCLGPNPPESCFIQPVVDPIIPPSSEGLTSPNGGGAFSSTPKETKDVTISEEIIEFVENALEAVVIGIVDTIEFIGKTIDNPVVEKINEKVVVPTIAAVGVANVAVGFQLPNILVYLRYLFSQPFLLMRRRKQKKWGVVYDAFTKQPIDLVTVRIVEKDSGSIVRTQVTDSQGRFFLILDPGSYKIETHRNGYVGFSEYLKHNKEDSNYSHIYHGEDIEVTDESIEMNYNIPLDPEVQDHTTARILKEHTKRFIQRLVSLLGIIITGASVVISPSIFIGVLFLIHIFIYLFFRRFALKKIGKNFGRVVDAITQTPLGKVVVRVFDQGYNKLIGTTVTDSKGRYAVLVGPSVYYTTYEKGGYDVKKSDEIDFSSEKTGGLGGIIVRDEKLSSMSNKKDDATPVKSRRIKKMNKRNKHRRVGTPSILQRKKGNGDIDKWKEIAQYGKKDS